MLRRAGPYDHIQAKIDTNLPEFGIPSHRVAVCVCMLLAGSHSWENFASWHVHGGERRRQHSRVPRRMGDIWYMLLKTKIKEFPSTNLFKTPDASACKISVLSVEVSQIFSPYGRPAAVTSIPTLERSLHTGPSKSHTLRLQSVSFQTEALHCGESRVWFYGDSVSSLIGHPHLQGISS